MTRPPLPHRTRPRWDEAMRLAHAVGAEATRTSLTAAAESAAAAHSPAAGHHAPDGVPLHRAIGRILAEDLRAAQPLPHAKTSAMDGYAVAGDPPWTLEDLPLGTPLLPGRARTIVTGGRVPAGTSGVVRQEYTDAGRSETSDTAPHRIALHPDAPASELEPGRHIRAAGREAAAGDLIAPAGRALTPPRAALAAICGFDEVPVHRARTAALLLTGDEVVTSGMPKPGQVRDAFEVQLPHVLAQQGVEVVEIIRIGDDRTDTHDALTRLAASADVVVTTGGTARSAADHVRAALEARADAHVVVEQLAMRPGHPTMLTLLDRGPGGARVPVLSLPGNPLAAMAALRVVGTALLRGLTGRAAEVPVTAPVAAPLPGEKTDRLVPATAAVVETATAGAGLSEPRWSPRPHVAAHMLRGLADATGWLVLPTHPVAAGERVPFLPAEW